MRPAGSWAPSMNVPTLLTTIRLLMAHPNGDDGLMPDITELFLKNPSRFADVARAHVEEHARQDKPSPATGKAAPPTERQTAEDTAAAPRDGGGKAGKTSVPSIATTSRDSGRPSAVGDKLGSLSPDKNSRSSETLEKPAAAAAGNDEVGKVSGGGVRSPPSPTGGNGNGTAEASSAADGDGSDGSHAGKGKGPAVAAQKPPDDADDCSSSTRRDSVENGGRAENDGDGASSDDGAWSESEDDDDDDDGGGTSNKRARTVM
ncbi:unnamed protein product [Ectocarpus sp. 4 AP-2014]